MNTQKNKNDRVKEVVLVLKKLTNLGLDVTDGFKDLEKILKEWVNDGKYKYGKIKLLGYDRIILYELFNKKGKEIVVNLKYQKNI